MIINHEHRFCFFAIPRTASKAISKLLLDEMGSEEIHKMHTSYKEFRQRATQEEKSYFTFATIRHPMDSVVSAYFKKKNDHNGRFSRGTFKGGRPIGARAMAEYRFIVDNDADFSTYFLKFYQEPYRIPRHEETARSVQMLLRFESLDVDFATLAAKKWNRPDLKIPVFNKTQGKSRNYLDYYTPEALERSEFVFGRLMKEWGY